MKQLSRPSHAALPVYCLGGLVGHWVESSARQLENAVRSARVSCPVSFGGGYVELPNRCDAFARQHLQCEIFGQGLEPGHRGLTPLRVGIAIDLIPGGPQPGDAVAVYVA